MMSAHSIDPDVEAWVQDARDADIVATAQRLGAQLRRVGSELVGPCPRCNGDDRFAIKPSERVFNCRGGGGGDVIAMVQHVRDAQFFDAVEFITGVARPNGKQEPAPMDDTIVRERRAERRDEEAAAGKKEKVKTDSTRARLMKLFDSAAPIAGTHAEAYLIGRGLRPPVEFTVDLRFVPELEYNGFVEGEDQERALGAFPCMVAAIRNLAGDIIGLHRTYLNPNEPMKLKPPGDLRRNKAKKVVGQQSGGLIYLGPILPVMAMGEGIETTFGWFLLGVGPEDVGLCCGVNLGNMAGRATKTIAHPTVARRTIWGGEPDMSKPGIILPDQVRELIMLGDGDSDEPDTYAKLLTGARRFRAEGRVVSVHMAPPKHDWASFYLSTREAEAA